MKPRIVNESLYKITLGVSENVVSDVLHILADGVESAIEKAKPFLKDFGSSDVQVVSVSCIAPRIYK
jgi:hypothetical protein